MKSFVEFNMVAGGTIKEGQVLKYDSTSHGLVPAVKDDPIVGVAAQTVDAGQGVAIHSFETGKVIQVLVHATVAEGAQLGVDASGNIITLTSSISDLPLTTVEAKTISGGDELVRCVTLY